jgi:hypothetical protein
LTVLACNLPLVSVEATPQVVTATQVSVQPAAPAVIPASEAPSVSSGNPTPAPGGGVMPTPSNQTMTGSGGNATPMPFTRPTLLAPFTESPPLAGVTNLPPADILFVADCSALPNRQPECDAYVNQTRELAYRNLRDLTGISLANCFPKITYTIVPGDVAEGRFVGYSNYDQIRFGENGSLDWGPGNKPYDVHELVHSFDSCSGAYSGGGHLLMGMMVNAVYERLGVMEMPYFFQLSDVLSDYQSRITESQSPQFSDIYSICEGLVGDRAILAYFQFGDPAVRKIYQSAIARQPRSQPNPIFANIFGNDTISMLAIVEALEEEFGTPMNVPACGF